MLLTAFTVTIVGPRFGDWLASQLGLSSVFAALGRALRWAIAISVTIVALEIIYLLGPNLKQRFGATPPGAFFSVVVWNVLSYLLEICFAPLRIFSRTHGTLAGFVASMTWLYWTSFALLAGAELNAGLAKQSKKGGIQS